MAQRGLRQGDLEYVLRYGQEVRNGVGGRYVFLGRDDVDLEDRAQRAWRLVGTTVVLDGEAVITVYRNRQAIKRLRRTRSRNGR